MKRVSSVLMAVCIFFVCILTCSASAFAASEKSVIPSYDDLEADAKNLIDAFVNVVTFKGGLTNHAKNIINFACNWLTYIDDLGWAISIFGRYYYLSNGVLKYFDGDISSGHGGVSSSPVEEPEDIYLPSDILSDIIEDENNQYSPKNKDIFYNSYRTDLNYHREDYPKSSSNEPIYITLFQDPIEKTRLNDLYCLPFYKAADGTMYYGECVFRYYLVENNDPNSDIALRVDVYKYNSQLGYIYSADYSGIIYEGSTESMPYHFRAFPFYDYSDFSIVSSLSDFSDWKASTRSVPYKDLMFYYYTSDYSTKYFINFIKYQAYVDNIIHLSPFFYSDGIQNACWRYSANPSKNNDYGFICSNEMISTVYDIDGSKIPSGQILQITGDNNVYNYYITNPETGQSSTVNNFVENNYTYITEGTGEGSGGTGGGVSGDINVGGKVDVNGNINVDININQSPSAYPDTDLVENLPEAPQGFLDYLAVMFGSLPSAILTLLVGGIAAAIFCRVWGR